MVKFIFRWAFRGFLVLLALIVAGILLLDTVAREFLEYRICNETGWEVKLGAVHIGLLNPELTLENFVLYNSAEFGGGPFLDLPELHLEYDRAALRHGQLHFKLVRFNVAQLNIVEDAHGRKNFEVLEQRLAARGASGRVGVRRRNGAPAASFGGIDTLNLSIGKVTFLRMSQPAQVVEYKLNVNHQVVPNIKTREDLSAAVLVALLRSGVNLMPGGGVLDWLPEMPKK